jgi:hypothetical protein
MSKKDYELIARTLRAMRQRYEADPKERAVVDDIAHGFGDVLLTTDQRFNRARFMAACRGEDSTDSAGRKVRYSSDPLAGQRS